LYNHVSIGYSGCGLQPYKWSGWC